MSTESVLKHHMEALKKGDLDEIMADYTEDSVMINGDNVVRGLAAIRQGFTAAVGAFGSIDLKNEAYEGEIGYMVWSVPGMIPFGTDTFVVRNDKILVQTVALNVG